jgi:hypothetical protein
MQLQINAARGQLLFIYRRFAVSCRHRGRAAAVLSHVLVRSSDKLMFICELDLSPASEIVRTFLLIFVTACLKFTDDMNIFV